VRIGTQKKRVGREVDFWLFDVFYGLSPWRGGKEGNMMRRQGGGRDEEMS